MDKKTAALTLTEKLREYNAPEIVINSHYQKKLVKEALACYQVGEMIAIASYFLRDNLKQKDRNLYEKIEPKANYFFIENFEMDKRLIASSFAIIGEEEMNQLRDIFYKNVPNDAEIAMKIFGIKKYAEVYKKYSSGELNNLMQHYNFYSKFKKSLDNLSFIEDECCTIENFEKYFGMSRKEINDSLKTMGFDEKAYSWADLFVNKKQIVSITRRLKTIEHFDLLQGFFNLVFTMPLEDQNIEANKTILQLPCDTLDSIGIVINEYFNGKNFQGYFECLDAEKQKKVISTLEFKKVNNAVYNSFLWSKGFKTIGLDHLRLYKNDSKGFMEYFDSKPVEEKKVIIKDLMECDVTNEEVVNWLTKNHIDLVREVGFQ